MRRRVTLAQIFGGAALALALVVVLAFALVVRSSRASILATSQRQQGRVARRIEARVVRELGRAQRVLEDVERGIRAGSIDVEKPASLEASLFTWIVDDTHLEEVTLTRATLLGYDAKGEAKLGDEGRSQLSVYRSTRGSVVTRTTQPGGAAGTYRVALRDRGTDTSLANTPFQDAGAAVDPTTHLTFSVIANKSNQGHAVWSDLHWSELDQALPPRERRVVLSVQKTIEDSAGRFLGVLRVGLVTNELDAIARAQGAGDEPEDVQRVALLATAPKGGAPRLVARLAPDDRMEAQNDEIRVVAARPPPEIRALLASPIVRGLDPTNPSAEGSLVVDGDPWLATLRGLDLGVGGTEGWMVAILAPESVYTSDLVAFERKFFFTFSLTALLLLVITLATFTAVRRGLSRITDLTNRMRVFDFAPQDAESNIQDVDDVMHGLERAKTVVRAMGKYVPLDLVRRLYTTNEEPTLGGELQEVSMMFTDIEGFTTLSEKLPPDELAERLGDYLAAMTRAIEATDGTIDKYIGDAVMALWNAPSRVDGHPLHACRAALACMKEARDLYASPAWVGLPPLVTRFGIHRATVMVGHFGAPSRLSYTALGDGVNLAARLEPLCKQYGVVALASETVVEIAKCELEFRRIDRVAVKGKTTGIDVYELLGEKGAVIPNIERARRYEEAFDAYLRRDFEGACALLEGQCESDPPSAVLARRCRDHVLAPPPDDWSGVHVASSK